MHAHVHLKSERVVALLFSCLMDLSVFVDLSEPTEWFLLCLLVLLSRTVSSRFLAV